MKRSWLRLGGPLLALVFLAVAAGPDEQRLQGLCLTALDVGQGDALLLEFPEGDPWLVDGGGIPGSRYDVGLQRVLPALRRRGIDRLGLVVMTHGDADHAGGLTAVLEHLEVERLLVPRRTRLGALERSVLSLAKDRGVRVMTASHPEALPSAPPGIRARVLHPGPGPEQGSSNDGSVVLHLGYGAVAMILTGDIEEAGEGALLAAHRDVGAQILKVAHHGSRTSSTPAFLDAVNPLVAVAGVGANNRFGFPHLGVTTRLRARGADLFTTAGRGEVQICTDGVSIEVQGRKSDRWEMLQRVGAERIAQWTSPVRAAAAPKGEGIGSSQSVSRPFGVGTRTRRGGGGRSQRKRTKSLAGARKSSSGGRRASEEPTPPPSILSDKEWERSRRDRRKPKPPWSSRR
ncbi:MAG: MBL fold metallo-hydrolase [Deltaproteobacteria bacterium]|nr:MBL fold metallo-hydrolase [Deltaproteobacteria bacterium]